MKAGLKTFAVAALGFFAATAFGDNARVTARSYVQKNLIAHWDGVNNDGNSGDGGFMPHNANATSWTDLVSNRQFVLSNSSGKWNDTYLQFSGTSPYVYGLLNASDTTATFGAIAENGVYEVALNAPAKTSSQYYVILKSHYDVTHTIGTTYNYFRNSKAPCYNLTPNINKSAATGTLAVKYTGSEASAFAAYADGVQVTTGGGADNIGQYVVDNGTLLGCRSTSSSSVNVKDPFPGKVYAIRLYDRQLSDDELKINAAIDRVRFYGGTADVSTLLPAGWDVADDGLLCRRYQNGSTLTVGTAYDDYNVQFDAGATVAVSALPEDGAAALTVTGKRAILKGDLAFTLPADLKSGTYTLVRADEVVVPGDASITVSSASEAFTCTSSVTETEITVEVKLSRPEAVFARIVAGQLVYFDAEGGVTQAPEGGMNDKITILFSSDAEYRALALIPETLAKAKGVALGDDVVLTADADWSAFAFEQAGHVLDLNGHALTVAQLAGDAEITDSSARVYERLEYIEAKGWQHIDTKYNLKENDVIDARFYVVNVQPYAFSMLLGAAKDSHWYWIGLTNGQNTNNIRYKRTSSPASGNLSKTAAFFNTLVDIHCEGKMMTWRTDTDAESLMEDGLTGDTVQSFYIFSEHDTDGGEYHSWARLYRLTVTSGGTVVRDFVPVRRSSDGELGLLDLAHLGSMDENNPEFYANDGKSVFTAGATLGGCILTKAGSSEPVKPGELHVNVAQGETVVNATVALTGALRLVKDGAGALSMTKTGQTYAGGTVVSNGLFTVAAGNEGTSRCLGVAGAEVEVAAGATLDLNGNTAFNAHPVILAGGTMRNSTGTATVGAVTLTADSTVKADSHVNATGLIDLGGFTLADENAEGMSFTLANGALFKDGCVKVSAESGAGWFTLNGSAKDMRTVDFIVNAPLHLNADASVRNWTVTAASAGDGAGHVNVYGSCAPATDSIRNLVMQDGSTLNLGVRARTLNCETLAFANGTVFVTPTRRGGKILGWADMPADTVVFMLAPGCTGMLARQADGLYHIRGLGIIVH